MVARGGFSEKPTTVFAPKFKSEKWDKLIESESTWSKAANEKYEKINSENDKIEFLNWIETVSKYCVHAKKSNCPIPNKIIELKSEVEKSYFLLMQMFLITWKKWKSALGADAKKRYAQEALEAYSKQISLLEKKCLTTTAIRSIDFNKKEIEIALSKSRYTSPNPNDYNVNVDSLIKENIRRKKELEALEYLMVVAVNHL